MSNLELIEALYNLVEQQAIVIRRLARALTEANAYTEAQKTMVEQARKEYGRILGAGEAPEPTGLPF